jgi:hypothetical protein
MPVGTLRRALSGSIGWLKPTSGRRTSRPVGLIGLGGVEVFFQMGVEGGNLFAKETGRDHAFALQTFSIEFRHGLCARIF